jgi:sigma-B regulation protein RsbU (phosphoserine phosphatase)
VASHDQYDWETGARSSVLSLQRQSPKALRLADHGNRAHLPDSPHRPGRVAVLFAFVYFVALMFGTALVRSITGSVHALSVGTMKLQRGDFSHRIIVHSKDQLGDLAQSFNSMSQGIEDLLESRARRSAWRKTCGSRAISR